MKYAHLDENNKLLAWYSDDIHSTESIPTGSIAVQEDVWLEAISINANYFDGYNFIDKDFRTEDELNNDRIRFIKFRANEIITDRYPLFKQLNAQMGLYGSEYLDKMTSFISDIIRQSNELEVSGTFNDFVVGE